MYSCEGMAMTQIRNVPPGLHVRLKERAATEGMNLSGYLKSGLERMASVPTDAEVLAKIQTDREAGRNPSIGVDEIVRGIREDRESH